MEEDDDDPVVDEMPVFLSHTLENQLYLFQYPTRAVNSGADMKVVKSLIKPQHQEVCLDLASDVLSRNYDRGEGEHLAINADSLDKTEVDRMYPTGVMDRTRFESMRVLTDADSLAVACIQGREVHLTPLRGLVSLQPTFPYLEAADQRAKEKGDNTDDEEVEEAKAVTVRFARPESDRLKRSRERSYRYLSQRSAEEPWYNTIYHPAVTQRAEVERCKLTTIERLTVDCATLSAADYLDQLVGREELSVRDIPALPSHAVSLNALRALPLPDQVKTVFRDVKLVSWGQLGGLLPGHEPLKLLRTVQGCAVMVQGNWVARSDLVYAKGSVSQHNGVPAETMVRARDYIVRRLKRNIQLHLIPFTLLLADWQAIYVLLHIWVSHENTDILQEFYLQLSQLNDRKYLERHKMAQIVKLPTEELKGILQEVARLRQHKGWEFLLPYDADFIKRYPEVVQRQNAFWEAKAKQLQEVLGTTAAAGSGGVVGGGRERRNSRRRESSMSGSSDLETETRSSGGRPIPQQQYRRRKEPSLSSDEGSTKEPRSVLHNGKQPSLPTQNKVKRTQKNRTALDAVVTHNNLNNHDS